MKQGFRSFLTLFVLFTLVYGSESRAQEGDSYITRLKTEADFERFSIPENGLPGVDRITKFLVPASDDPDLLPTVFQNVNQFALHEEFLAATFPDRFPGLGGREYQALVERRETRSYFAGVLFRFPREPGTVYGFDVFTAANDPDELPRPDEIGAIFQRLRSVFTLGDIAYSPKDQGAIRNASEWKNPDFPIDFAFRDLGDLTFLPYTVASNYGTVRIFTAASFAEENDSGGFGSQDIIVIDEAPPDIEGLFAAVITGSLQNELGHLAIRAARRGTPNAFVRDATDALEQYEGRLIRLDVTFTGVDVTTEVTLDEAQAWWTEHRPDVDIPDVDADYDALDDVLQIEIDGSVDLVTRYGGKGGNFARLQQLLPEEHRVPGFVVPFSYGIDFLEANTTTSRTDPQRTVTLAQYVDELLDDPGFQIDSRQRFSELETLRDLIEDGDVSPQTVDAITTRARAIFPDVLRTVRFRSSSNAEDTLEFNGAGLYRSTSVCIADELDSDDRGPSRCDRTRSGERGVARGLKRVWASLWNFRAYEEREFFQIDHRKANMAVLVSEGFPDELANGVSFTGNPTLRGDRKFVVNAQPGDASVVSADDGEVAEKTLLEIIDGQVADITRVRPSTLVEPGVVVLSDDNLRELGRLMASVENSFPIDLGSNSPDAVLLDFEFKLDARSGGIRFKQVRPFLIADTGGIEPHEFQLVVPEGMVACASFKESRPNIDVLVSKARLGFKAGESTVRNDRTSQADVFDWLEFSPDGPRHAPVGPGLWTAEPANIPHPVLKYTMHQDFVVDDQLIRLSLRGLAVPIDEEGETVTVVLDAPALTWGDSPYFLTVDYASVVDGREDFQGATPLLPCDLDHLPLHTVDAEFSNGDRVHFEERFKFLTVGTGPAELVHATVSLGGQEHVVEDYWRLVYSAGHHNDRPFPELWAIFESPIDVDGVGPVKVVAVAQKFIGDDPTAFFLDETFQQIHRPEIVFFRRQAADGEVVPQFRRGDSNGSGVVNVSDALTLLNHIFRDRPIACADAADFDDLGTLDVGDAVLLLFHLFLGLDPPAPPGPERCGEDVGEDELETCDGGACR